MKALGYWVRVAAGLLVAGATAQAQEKAVDRKAEVVGYSELVSHDGKHKAKMVSIRGALTAKELEFTPGTGADLWLRQIMYLRVGELVVRSGNRSFDDFPDGQGGGLGRTRGFRVTFAVPAEVNLEGGPLEVFEVPPSKPATPGASEAPYATLKVKSDRLKAVTVTWRAALANHGKLPAPESAFPGKYFAVLRFNYMPAITRARVGPAESVKRYLGNWEGAEPRALFPDQIAFTFDERVDRKDAAQVRLDGLEGWFVPAEWKKEKPDAHK